MPRLDRGIQYAAAVVHSHKSRRGVLDRPVKPGDDTVTAANYRTRSRCAASCRLSCWQSLR
ncbi:hypothetical protein DCG74_08435 [Bradyrhizobium sp. WBAH42]|nr:hypothetical protein [Bradyrhizobium sp. WBAH30]MDD1544944.1 hypothetical protein [Bradyrhizobium sp. WBAH41]MDD1558373.1 hypothetical protein [Bradyrhizobium sp. WBAH23]MDD1565771.1 hypothetical protein [Bradyrhizobium sp. WBAH33]MDD1591151.1 hypothetical protein [Bradyrhizobium sp. WBAH42]NRB89449.1 hypothetical protein [Bradyrhizobium sp. WBAH10]QCJ88590.1 hypothetical protein DAA57_08785 [Bradyrhizobium yuanmingense]